MGVYTSLRMKNYTANILEAKTFKIWLGISFRNLGYNARA